MPIAFFARLQRVFLSQGQRELLNPDDYDVPIRPLEIRAEVLAGKMHIDNQELREAVLGVLLNMAREPKPMTIRNLRLYAEGIEPDRYPEAREDLVLAKLGAEVLLNYLSQRANGLVKPRGP